MVSLVGKTRFKLAKFAGFNLVMAFSSFSTSKIKVPYFLRKHIFPRQLAHPNHTETIIERNQSMVLLFKYLPTYNDTKVIQK